MASSYRHARGKRALGGKYYGAPRSIPCHECGKHVRVRALKDINIRGDKVFCDKCARRLQRTSEKSASRKSSARTRKMIR